MSPAAVGVSVLLCNVSNYLPDYMESHPRRKQCGSQCHENSPYYIPSCDHHLQIIHIQTFEMELKFHWQLE